MDGTESPSPISANAWIKAHPEFKIAPKPKLKGLELGVDEEETLLASVANPYVRMDEIARMREDLDEMKKLLKDALNHGRGLEQRISQQDALIQRQADQLRQISSDLVRLQHEPISRGPIGSFLGSLSNPGKLPEIVKPSAAPLRLPEPSEFKPDVQKPAANRLTAEIPAGQDGDDGDYEDDETPQVLNRTDYTKQVKTLDEILGKYNYYRVPESPKSGSAPPP